MNGNNRKGFTLVEAIIVVVVIAVLLAIFIPIARERERERLQALADSEPWEVFELRAAPAQESFSMGEDVVVLCEMVNATNFALTPPEDLGRSVLVFEGETDYFFDVQLNESTGLPPAIHTSGIGPGESVHFELRFYPIGVGKAQVSLAYWAGTDEAVSRRRSFALITLQGRFENRENNDVFQADEKCLQSNAFQLLIGESGYTSPTFEEILADQ